MADGDDEYKVSLLAANMQTPGTYTLDIQATGSVETGSSPTTNLIIDLTIKACDDTTATFGDFDNNP